MKKSIFLICILYGIIAAYRSSLFYIEAQAYIPPSAEKRDISLLALKSADEYSESDYELIRSQTGLGRSAVMSLTDWDSFWNIKTDISEAWILSVI